MSSAAVVISALTVKPNGKSSIFYQVLYNLGMSFNSVQSKKIGNGQELTQSNPISRPQDLKGKKYILHKLTEAQERHAR